VFYGSSEFLLKNEMKLCMTFLFLTCLTIDTLFFVSYYEIRINFNNILFVRLCAATVTLPSLASSIKYSVGYMDSLSPIPVTWAVRLAFLAFAFLTEPFGHGRQHLNLRSDAWRAINVAYIEVFHSELKRIVLFFISHKLLCFSIVLHLFYTYMEIHLNLKYLLSFVETVYIGSIFCEIRVLMT